MAPRNPTRDAHAPAGLTCACGGNKPGIVFAELKTDRGRVTEPQWEVIVSLREAGVYAEVWRPKQWPLIEKTLRDGPDMGALWAHLERRG